MNFINKIQEKLEKSDSKYTLHKVPSDVGISVDEHVKAFNLDYSDVCICVIFKADDKFIALLHRADCSIDKKKLKEAIGVSNIRIANPVELKDVTGFELGVVSPILLELDIFIDKKVLVKDSVRIGTGGNEYSLGIATSDLINVTIAKVIDVTYLNPGKASLRVLSGITPSSSKGLHLGNYLGAVKPQVEFQSKSECLYFIADYHALNTVFDPVQFRSNVYETYLDYLALGIDLNKTIFFVESYVKEIFELTEILNNSVTLAQMKRMHAFKDKLANPDADIDQINMGLFNYPILMAADILAFEPDIIPVGEDQSQHVEVCRDIAQNFNRRYGSILKVPDLYIKESVARVPGTDGERKMSKSLGNDLTIFAEEEILKKQVMGITTDPGRIKKDDPGDPTKNVIFKYLDLMDFDKSKLIEYEDRYKAGTIGDVELKKEFFGFFLNYFEPFRAKRAELSKDKGLIFEMMKQNGEKARKIAQKVMERVRNGIGA